jgi:hypothetical protein
MSEILLRTVGIGSLIIEFPLAVIKYEGLVTKLLISFAEKMAFP